MAYSNQRTVSDGTLKVLMLTIAFFDKSEISVFVDDVPHPFTWATSTSIEFPTALPAGSTLVVRRTTDISEMRHIFTAGAQFTNKTLDEDYTQMLHIAQESVEGSYTKELFNDLDMHRYRVRNMAPAILTGDAVPLEQVQSLIESSRTLKQAIRVPDSENSVNPMPPFPLRAGRLLSFDASGQPIMVAPASGSATELALDLNSPDLNKGATQLGRVVVAVATLAELRALPLAARRVDACYLVRERVLGSGTGGGEFYWAPYSKAPAVSIDPAYGLTVPPNSDPTGQSGAFSRVFSGPMAADWFGVEYGSTVDCTAYLQAATTHIRAGRGLVVQGDVRIDGTWDMSNIPMAWRVNVLGTIWAGPGPQTTVRIAGIYSDFAAFRFEKVGGVRLGLALECLSMFMGDIKIMSIDKFENGARFIGVHSRADGVNGIAWCNVDIRNINVADIPVLITTRTDTPGKTNGYVNENTFNIGYMGGRKGIWFKRGPEQTGGAFGGNKINKPGFEQITDPNEAALDMEYCSRNTVEDWRFEGPGIKGLQIREDSACSRNVYRGSHALTNTKLAFNGILATIDAEIITIDGGLIAVSARQLGNDSALSYNAGDAWNINVNGDAVEQRVREPSLGYPMRIQTQSPTGVRGFVEVKPRVWYQSGIGLAVLDVLPGVNLISISPPATGVMVVNMPLALELNGRTLQLNVTTLPAGATVSIRKSSGTANAGAGITSAGLYALAYFGDVWRISKLGEAYSA